MLVAARKIEQYTATLTFNDFAADPKTIDAVVRNLSIIGEATRHIPDSVQALAPSVPWAAIRGMRHRIIHEYAQVDVAVVWDTVTHDLPPLIPALESLLNRPSQ
jgi:uncharacterized protein with HEPN domain